MKIQGFILLLAFASVATAQVHLRSAPTNPFQEFELEQYSCTIEGAGGQDQCDAAKDESGEQCVWCSVGSFGACLSADQAALIEDKIPGLTCDDQNDDDAADDDQADDASPVDDDASPADDDASPPDDDSNYWKCLKDGSESEDACKSADGCTWCKSKAGFGICLDDDAAKMASDSAWLDCKSMDTLELMDLMRFKPRNKKKRKSRCQVTQPASWPLCNKTKAFVLPLSIAPEILALGAILTISMSVWMILLLPWPSNTEDPAGMTLSPLRILPIRLASLPPCNKTRLLVPPPWMPMAVLANGVWWLKLKFA